MFRRFAWLALALIVPAAALSAQTPEDYQKRREAVRSRMEPGSVLILRSAIALPDAGPFRQENNLFYLTGLDEPDIHLILVGPRPDVAAGTAGRGGMGRGLMGGGTEFLFVPPTPSEQPAAQPAPPGPGAMPALSRPGFRTVLPASSFQGFFDRILLGGLGTNAGPATIYLDYQRSRDVSSPLTPDEQLLKQARDKGGDFRVKPVGPLVAPSRQVKTTSEVATLKRAAAITAEAEKEVMRAAKPGMFEYQLQSVLEHVFSVNGARRPGFDSIVGSGPNSCILHWADNTRRTQGGDLVVIDIGAEFARYTADITRTIPISGTFTKRQRILYEAVLRANQAAIEMVKPGAKMLDINNRVRDVLADGVLALGLAKDKAEAMARLGQYYMHGLSHSIGLEVHDVGSVATLEAGMVVTIEPGLYLKDESMGVRIEDDVLVTESGHEVITDAAPKTVEAVEALMKQRGGMDFTRYLVK